MKTILMMSLVLSSVGLISASVAEARTLYTFDLTHTLKLNADDVAQRRKIWDETHFVASVQGIVNRQSPTLYVYLVGDNDAKIDHYWLDKFQADGQWLSSCKLKALRGLDPLVRLFRRQIKGLVVYDENVPATSNAASTVAGVHDFACVRFDKSSDSLYHWLVEDSTGPRLPVKVWLVNKDGSSLFTGRGTIPGTQTPSTGSAKCDAYTWAKVKLLDTGKCDPTAMGYYIDSYWIDHPGGYVPNHTLSNHDYFISKRAFFFDLSPWDDEAPVDDPSQPLGCDVRTMQAILRSAWEQTRGAKMIHVGGFVPWDKKYTNAIDKTASKHDDVPGEWRYAEILSCFNAFMDADALGYSAMANASVFCHYPLKPKYVQKLPTAADLKASGYITEDGKVAAKSFVTIYVGDYDSAAWLYQRMPYIWTDPVRGSIPLGWAFNPNLAQRFAAGIAHFRETATAGDFFVSGDSGAGYINPGYLSAPRRFSDLPSGVKVWEEHCRRYFDQWDLSMVGFVIDGYGPQMSEECLDAYSSFSPAGLVGQKLPSRMGMHGDMPYIRMGADLPGPPERAASIIERETADELPQFRVYRTILWNPSGHKTMFDAVESSPKGKNVQFVDPYTFMLLVKHHLGSRQE